MLVHDFEWDLAGHSEHTPPIPQPDPVPGVLVCCLRASLCSGEGDTSGRAGLCPPVGWRRRVQSGQGGVWAEEWLIQPWDHVIGPVGTHVG